MILLNAAILSLVIYEGIFLIKEGLKKELVVYLSIFILVIIVEFLCITIPGGKNFAALILEMVK